MLHTAPPAAPQDRLATLPVRTRVRPAAGADPLATPDLLLALLGGDDVTTAELLHGASRKPADRTVALAHQIAAAEDERLLLAMLRRPAPLWTSQTPVQAIILAMLRRAVDRATAEGIVWTPVLDALASDEFLRRPSTETLAALKAAGLPVITSREYLAPVVAALATATEEDVLALLAMTRSYALPALVVSAWPAMTAGVAAALGRTDAAHLVPLRADYTREHAEALLAVLAARVARATDTGLACDINLTRPPQGPFVTAVERTARVLRWLPPAVVTAARSAYEAMLAQQIQKYRVACAGGTPYQAWASPAPVAALVLANNPALTRAEAAELLAVAPKPDVIAAIGANEALTDDAFAEVAPALKGNLIGMTLALKRRDPLPGRFVRHLVAEYRTNGPDLGRVLRQPACTLDLAQEAAARAFAFEPVRDALATDPRWRQDPTIRAKLLNSSTQSVVTALLQGGTTGREFNSLFPRLATADPATALRILRSGPIPTDAAVKPERLIKAFVGASPETMIQLMELLGSLPAAPRTPAPRSTRRGGVAAGGVEAATGPADGTPGAIQIDAFALPPDAAENRAERPRPVR